MRGVILYLSLAFLFLSCENEAQIIIESQPARIEFKTSYKLNSSIEKKLKNDDKPWKYDTAFLDYCKKGEYKKALELDNNMQQIEPHIPLTANQIDSIYAKYSVVDAVKYSIKQAKQNRITIINEEHHNPRHRVFTRSLLKELYNSGYTHLGLETLYNGQKGGTPMANGSRILDEKDLYLNDRKYPIIKSGVYSQEPQMANLIRQALEIGFIVFSYEKTGVGSGYPREIGQAKNIKAVMDKNPNAKILIHCGASHGHEGVGLFGPGGKAMAGWLKELTGIDPLTIDQMKYSEKNKLENNPPIYNALNLENSSVLIDSSGNPMQFIQNDAYADFAVIHPPTKYFNSRPSWLFQYGVKNVEMDLSFIDIDFPAMILAFNEGENIENALPIDIVDANDNKTSINLALSSGQYNIVVINIESDAVKFKISVK